jgi:hypothetical protein
LRGSVEGFGVRVCVVLGFGCGARGSGMRDFRPRIFCPQALAEKQVLMQVLAPKHLQKSKC